jgi:pimeloyl-ACP methyl ester carboxylesterase
MPQASVNSITLNYEVTGSGPLVVLIMGTGSPGRVWQLHQVPALVAAGFRVCTFDSRGIAPSSECPEGFTIDDLVADTAALIPMLGSEPAHLVGTSMGARVAQELALAHPKLVRRAVFLAGHARLDQFQKTLSAGEEELDAKGVALPPRYEAALTAVMNLSPATMADSDTARDWLDVFEFSGGPVSPGVRAQRRMDHDFDRRVAYRAIAAPCLALGFADDRMIPPHLTREVAEIIPGCVYREIPGTGHFGYLERPAEVNRAIIDFLQD